MIDFMFNLLPFFLNLLVFVLYNLNIINVKLYKKRNLISPSELNKLNVPIYRTPSTSDVNNIIRDKIAI